MVTIQSTGTVRIHYCNANGTSSTRIIHIRKIYRSKYGTTYIRAYCDLREEERTFRADRILWWEQAESNDTSVHQKPVRKTTSTIPNGPIIQKSVSPVSGLYGHDCRKPKAPKAKRSRGGNGGTGFLIFLSIGLCIFIYAKRDRILSLAGDGVYTAGNYLRTIVGYQEPVPEKSYVFVPNPEPTPEPDPIVVKPEPEPEPEPAAIPTPMSSEYETEVRKRARRFTEDTGIIHAGLIDWFIAADSDRNMLLSWDEIQNFQTELYVNYSYLSNATALRPADFVYQGGGDCEDFAIMSVALIRFWGGRAFVGSFAPTQTGTGHAICLVYADGPVDFGMHYELEQPMQLHYGGTAPAGYYIPVDYDHVAGISNAMRKSWTLRAMYCPENIYGTYM